MNVYVKAPLSPPPLHANNGTSAPCQVTLLSINAGWLPAHKENPPEIASDQFLCKLTYLQYCMYTGRGKLKLAESRSYLLNKEHTSILYSGQFEQLSPSYDLAPLPPSPSPHPVSKLDRDTHEGWERETTCWREKGGGGGVGANSYDCKKVWSSINHSMALWLSLFLAFRACLIVKWFTLPHALTVIT